MKAITGVVLAILGVMIVAAGFYFLVDYKLDQFVTVGAPQSVVTSTDGAQGSTAGEENFCANNPDLDMEVRVKNALSTSGEYQNGTLYVRNLATGTIKEQTISGTAAGSFTDMTNILKCGNSAGYELYLKTTQDGFNAGTETVTIEASGLFADPVEVTLTGSKHSLVKVKAYDNDLRQNMYADNSADYDTLPASFNETGATDPITVDADGFLDVSFTMAPATPNEAAGREAVLCVNYADDSNQDDWDQDSISLTYEGSSLSEVALSANDVKALSAYESCYALPHPVGMSAAGKYDSISDLRFYIASQAGINPDFDPVIRYVELGTYLSVDDDSMVLTGVGARDNTARTFVGSATASLITLDIA